MTSIDAQMSSSVQSESAEHCSDSSVFPKDGAGVATGTVGAGVSGEVGAGVGIVGAGVGSEVGAGVGQRVQTEPGPRPTHAALVVEPGASEP
jgi:hypothetical protein